MRAHVYIHTHAHTCAYTRDTYGRMRALTPTPNPLRPPAKYKCARCIVHTHTHTDAYMLGNSGRMHRVAHKRCLETEGRATVTRKYGRASFSSPFSLSSTSAILFPRAHEFPFFFVAVRGEFQWLRVHRYRLIHETQPVDGVYRYATLSLSKYWI